MNTADDLRARAEEFERKAAVLREAASLLEDEGHETRGGKKAPKKKAEGPTLFDTEKGGKPARKVTKKKRTGGTRGPVPVASTIIATIRESEKKLRPGSLAVLLSCDADKLKEALAAMDGVSINSKGWISLV